MDWIPIVFVTFKLLVLGTGMYFAIKWHYDRAKKMNARENRAVLGAIGKVVVIFLLALTGLLLITFFVSRKLGLDLSLS